MRRTSSPESTEAANDNRAAYLRAVSGWVKPERRIITEPDGQQSILYECAICRDTGWVLLPRSKAAETDADLLAVGGASFPYHCPGCRPEAARLRFFVDRRHQGNPAATMLSPRLYQRLLRWHRLRSAELALGHREEAAAPDDRTLERPGWWMKDLQSPSELPGQSEEAPHA